MQRYAAAFAPSSRVSFLPHVWRQIIIFVHYDIIFTTRILITLSNCRTAGRYATPAALYLFLHTVVLGKSKFEVLS